LPFCPARSSLKGKEPLRSHTTEQGHAFSFRQRGQW
jgi:hypothetical protein